MKYVFDENFIGHLFDTKRVVNIVCWFIYIYIYLMNKIKHVILY